jgi:hypothetical protein
VAVDFTPASRLNGGLAGISAPGALHCLFNADDATAVDCPMQIADASASFSWIGIRIRGDVGGDPIELFVHDWGSGGDTGIGRTSTGFTQDAWHSGYGYWNSSGQPTCYLDNGGVGSDTEGETITGIDAICIGAAGADASPGNYFDGSLANAAVYNVDDLDSNERQMLADGFSPILVRPTALVWWIPLFTALDLTDRMGNGSLTVGNGTPADGVHPPVYEYVAPYYPPPTEAVAPGVPVVAGLEAGDFSPTHAGLNGGLTV